MNQTIVILHCIVIVIALSAVFMSLRAFKKNYGEWDGFIFGAGFGMLLTTLVCYVLVVAAIIAKS